MSQADVFKRLEPLLIDAIPKAVKAESINQPVCTLRVYYYDTHAPCTYLLLRAMSAQRRAQLLEEKGQSALYYLWAANEEGCDGPEIALDGPPTVAELFAQVYDLLCESENNSCKCRFLHPKAGQNHDRYLLGRLPGHSG